MPLDRIKAGGVPRLFFIHSIRSPHWPRRTARRTTSSSEVSALSRGTGSSKPAASGYRRLRASAGSGSSLLRPGVPSGTLRAAMAKRKQWRRGRLALYSIHVVIPYRRSVVTEDSRRWPHPFSGVLTPTFGTQPQQTATSVY